MQEQLILAVTVKECGRELRIVARENAELDAEIHVLTACNHCRQALAGTLPEFYPNQRILFSD